MQTNLYNQFTHFFPQFANKEYTYLDLKSQNFQPLSLEWVSNDHISIMQTFETNGDLCYDPMMEFKFDRINKVMSPLYFQQSIPYLYQYFDSDGIGKSVYSTGNIITNENLLEELTNFANEWFTNISEQQYMPIKGIIKINGENTMITFDDKGKPILPETKEKPYDLGYGSLGNGITVWNRLEEQNGDYKTVAHIKHDRSVKFYEPNMPIEVKNQIIKSAHSFIDTALDPIKTLETDNNYPLPDPFITTDMLNKYGYTSENMLPLSIEKALVFFDSNHPLYLLYPDNTEGMALECTEIQQHNGFCGIDKEDWERSPLYATEKSSTINFEGNLEADLLYGDANKFGIYQISRDLDNTKNYSIERSNYNLVYTAPITTELSNHTESTSILEQIYKHLNMWHPANFKGNSISVGDVIVLKTAEGISSHFIDTTGFTKLEAFLGIEQLTFSQVGKSSKTIDKTTSYTENTKQNQPTKPKLTLMDRLNEGKKKALESSEKNNPVKDIEGVRQ